MRERRVSVRSERCKQYTRDQEYNFKYRKCRTVRPQDLKRPAHRTCAGCIAKREYGKHQAVKCAKRPDAEIARDEEGHQIDLGANSQSEKDGADERADELRI